MALNSPEHPISNPIDREETTSVCPICLRRVKAWRVIRDDTMFLHKSCPEHGFFETPIWRGNVEQIRSSPVRIPAFPENPFTQVRGGCPFDCGLCPDHRQQPCCVLLEVTQSCDLVCPVCFASAGETKFPADPDLSQIETWYDLLMSAGGPFNIQLSGGEPCIRDDLHEIIAIGRSKGFTFFQVNTNGLRLARDPAYLSKLKEAGLSTVYLQFDGTEEKIYEQLRGKPLFEIKKKAIENCRDLNIGVVLVPTIKPGVNDHNIGDIIRYALANHPVVRGVHFQPISYFGRYSTIPSDSDRITLPEVVNAIHKQTDGLIPREMFKPSGGPNRMCSFSGNLVVMPDGKLKPIIKPDLPSKSCPPQNSAEERIKSQSFVARNWVAPVEKNETEKKGGKPVLGGWDTFLARARTHLFAISGMAFQDAWTLDLERLRDCYIMVVSPDNHLIPFCAYNLTGQDGKALYRK